MRDRIYNSSRDPWPNLYVVSALMFFAMEPAHRNSYVVADFPEVLFHGTEADWKSGDALETVTMIFSEILGLGSTLDLWRQSAQMEALGIADQIQSLYEQLTDREVEELLANWNSSKKVAGYILGQVGWHESGKHPPVSCARLLNEYSYGAYDEAIGS